MLKSKQITGVYQLRQWAMCHQIVYNICFIAKMKEAYSYNSIVTRIGKKQFIKLFCRILVLL